MAQSRYQVEPYLQALYNGLLQAAGVLSQTIRQGLRVSPAQVMTLARGAHPMGWPEDAVCGAVSQLSGDLFGSTALIFPAREAEAMGAIAADPTGQISPEMISSALEEIDNIFVNMAMAGLSREHGFSIFNSVPGLTRGTLSQLWSRVSLPQVSSPETVVLYSDIEASGPGPVSQGYFVLCLSEDSLARLSEQGSGQAAARIEVGMGEIKLASAPTVLKATSLGSCLAVILHDQVRKTGCMAHVLLPEAPSAELGKLRPGKYADTAVRDLVNKMSPLGPHIRAWLVGGAHMFPKISGMANFQVGRQNVDVARKELAEAGIRKMGQEVGGNHGRTVEFFPATGEVWMRSGFLPQKVQHPLG
ncbi:MAG: hypothetical protein HY549_08500 [Elusimicrobia bacterium]|nr:hypothetical protein [Elusimicrobiota bacterium]